MLRSTRECELVAFANRVDLSLKKGVSVFKYALGSGPVTFACSASLAFSLAPGVAWSQSDDEASTLDPVVVSSSRRETPVSETARSITVVDQQEIEDQTRISRNIGEILANTVPGMAPSTESVTNFGQTLRGRKFLVLVDGIPQSTPLRDASRDLNTIAPSSIERIEVVRGGTAVYGFGATGGVVNIITKKAASEPVEGYSQVGARISTEETSDSTGLETEHRISGTQGKFDYVLSGSYVEREGRFDADGKRIPPDPLGTQGGFADTEEHSLLAKGGWNFDGGRQRLEFMVNDLDNEQDTDFTFDSQLDGGRTPAIPISEAPAGSRPIKDPGTENTTARLTYSHENVAGSSIQANAYYGDQSIIFPRFPGFKQGEIASEKQGLRTTVETPLSGLREGTTLTWGADYLGDETEPDRFGGDGTVDTPAMDQDAYAVFGEVETPLADVGLFRAGIRQEEIDVEVSTVDENINGNTVRGGELEWSETLFNAGAVFFATESIDVFTNFSQGFTVGDIGRVIRDGGAFGAGDTLDAEDFESDAEKVDNYEVGMRYYGSAVQGSAAVFFTDSDDGATFDDNQRIQKFEEEIWGFEGTLDWAISDDLKTGGSLTWADGQRLDDSGDKTRLDGTRISPVKISTFVRHQVKPWWSNRFQIQYVGNRTQFDNAEGPENNFDFGKGDVDDYTLVHLTSRFDLPAGSLALGVRNLLNEDYFPAISQAFNIPTARSKGRGRTVSASYELEW